MKGNKSVIFLGFSDFPYGLAEAQKIILISKSLQLMNSTVTVICRNGNYNQNEKPLLKVDGFHENIHYIYASGSCFRNDNFFKRRFFEIKGKFKEFLILRKMAHEKNVDFAILSTKSFLSIILYYIYGKIFNFKIILNYVEYYSSIKNNKFNFIDNFNDILFDKFSSLFSNAVFPISTFLEKHVRKISPKKRIFKIPILTDFNKYQTVKVIEKQKNYFLFCGHASYKEVIKFIIDSYEIIANSSYFLYLIINGYDSDKKELRDYVKSKKISNKINIFSNLTEDQLYSYYKNADGLLIPLRPTLQDEARFPHKIGEYLASGNPIISTDFGEVNYYFSDMKNMLIAKSYNPSLFAEKMKFIIDFPAESKIIGEKGKEIAMEKFDYQAIAEPLNEFLNTL